MKYLFFKCGLLLALIGCSHHSEQQLTPEAIIEELTKTGFEQSWPAASTRMQQDHPTPADCFKAIFLAGRLHKKEESKRFLLKGFAVTEKSDPMYAELLIYRSQQHVDNQDYVRAAKDLDSALAINPKSIVALQNLGYIAAISNENELAVSYSLRLLEVAPGDSGALVNLSYSCGELGMYSDAIKYAKQGLAKVKEEQMRASLLNNMGYSMGMSGDMEKGMQHIDSSLRLRPENPYAWCNKGILLLKQDKKGLACEAFRMAKDKGGLNMTEHYIRQYCQ
ncbi:hypothetical protein [Chitinophaga caseinilytica]|uniref:Tetratricopeptide repeat protein n=1 Tax=Chitinophaga caseinilytica TaxID=2267521 RepID=A0ABZ2Z8H5_9BACT